MRDPEAEMAELRALHVIVAALLTDLHSIQLLNT